MLGNNGGDEEISTVCPVPFALFRDDPSMLNCCILVDFLHNVYHQLVSSVSIDDYPASALLLPKLIFDEVFPQLNMIAINPPCDAVSILVADIFANCGRIVEYFDEDDVFSHLSHIVIRALQMISICP
jgi:hypothetical protein